MAKQQNHQFSGPVSVFQELRLPEQAQPVGYAALIDAYDLAVPLPLILCAIGRKHQIIEAQNWRLYTPRHAPAATLEGHLTFALKYEGVDLCVLKKLFETIDGAELAGLIQQKPNSAYLRRIWFLYEWLLGTQLELPNAKTGTYAHVVDPKLQWAVKGSTSTRHRVHNNLPGTPDFCPMVRRTSRLEQFVARQFDQEARAIVGRISQSILSRTAAFLLLKDSKSSYAIEGEAPPHDRIQRWGKAIGEAGRHPLDEEEFLRLQRLVIGKDTRFIQLGWRHEGGFVGEHELDTRLPLPEHISAKPEDLPTLIAGLIQFDQGVSDELDPVIAAAMLAFGFVYIHPFEDGNGRLHRYLIHHILSARGFNPPGMVFPISAAILDRIEDYRRVLESHSARILPLIEWRTTPSMNVDVTNDTADFYRYFDATPHAEFLFECVERTIEQDLPQEAEFLTRYDQFKSRIEAHTEMPASMIDLLFNFLRQNQGKFSNRARQKEFAALTDDEVVAFEEIYAEIFEG
ncbi:Fic family protein [Maritalea mobilis]|uniref:Fic family protein n=1 Tax=Maritalea mobilis TaxID=483324 RepID=A0A4R6VGK2_9HYPH|nr:Fic family protein [Maritalea mobilis]TDQ60404.1 Fic family protein [Maritalea mobilis]